MRQFRSTELPLQARRLQAPARAHLHHDLHCWASMCACVWVRPQPTHSTGRAHLIDVLA